MGFLKKFWNCLSVWNIPTADETEISKADVIVTQAFSFLNDGSPGPINHILANLLRDLHKKHPEKPIIAQDAVAFAAPEIKYIYIVRTPADETIKRSSSSWNTESVARLQVEICRKRGWKKIAFIAACPIHQGRVLWAMKRLGVEPIPIEIPRDKDYFHPDSANWFARSRLRFFFREFLCRFYFLLTGRI